METSAQYVPQVGDVVEVVNLEPSVGKFFFIGDVGEVRRVDEDNSLRINFNDRGNKRVFGAGEWFVRVETVRLVSRPVADIQPPVLSELLGERDALRDELAAAKLERDELAARVRYLESQMQQPAGRTLGERVAFDPVRAGEIIEQRDRLLDALIEARPYVPDHHGPVQARILAAIASVEGAAK